MGNLCFVKRIAWLTDTTWASFDGASATPATDWNTNVATNYAVTNIGWNTTSISGAGAQTGDSASCASPGAVETNPQAIQLYQMAMLFGQAQ